MSLVAIKAIQEPLARAQREVKDWYDLTRTAGNEPMAAKLAQIERLLDVAALACMDAREEADALSEIEVPAA